MDNPKFKTSKGLLTMYALACGYMEVSRGYGKSGTIDISMYLDGCFHVRGYSPKEGRLFWDCFDTLPEARKSFFSRLKEYRLKRKIPS